MPLQREPVGARRGRRARRRPVPRRRRGEGRDARRPTPPADVVGGRGDRVAARAGGGQPDRQRRQVHAARRPRRRRGRAARAARAVLRVRDTGPGIPAGRAAAHLGPAVPRRHEPRRARPGPRASAWSRRSSRRTAARSAWRASPGSGSTFTVSLPLAGQGLAQGVGAPSSLPNLSPMLMLPVTPRQVPSPCNPDCNGPASADGLVNCSEWNPRTSRKDEARYE